MTILEKSSLHEEFHEVDHYESVDEVLIDGASYLREVDTGEPVGSSALRAIATGIVETTLGGGFKNSSNI
ncbi:hypothetical protein Tco_1453695, partial [Tanacetum coccineum]